MKKAFIITMLVLAGVFSIMPMGAARHAEAGVIKGIVLYIPNRIFDVLDIVCLRLRVGPGLSAGVSATELADVFVGGHTSVYAGFGEIPLGCRGLRIFFQGHVTRNPGRVNCRAADYAIRGSVKQRGSCKYYSMFKISMQAE